MCFRGGARRRQTDRKNRADRSGRRRRRGAGLPGARAAGEPVEFDGWAGFGVANCSYLAPKDDFVHDGGAVDVIWHFHAGQMATADMKTSNARAVFVSCGYGIGTGGYSSNFDDPNRFGGMMRSLTRTLARKAGARG